MPPLIHGRGSPEGPERPEPSPPAAGNLPLARALAGADAEAVRLARAFAALAQRMAALTDPRRAAQEVVRLSGEITECDAAAVSMAGRDGGLELLAGVGRMAEETVAVQHRLHEGPCLAAIATGEQQYLADRSRETRWPVFVRRLPALGVGSMLSCPLSGAGRRFGTLSLYARKSDAFDAFLRSVADVFASHAAVAVTGADARANLHRAVDSRQQIGEAVGILAERHDLTPDAAFDLLSETSQDHNIKVRDLADRLVADQERADDRKPGARPPATDG